MTPEPWQIFDAAALGLVLASAYRRVAAAREQRAAAQGHRDSQAFSEEDLGEVDYDAEHEGAGTSWVVEVFRQTSDGKVPTSLSDLASDMLAAKRAAQHLVDASKKAHEVLVIAGGGPVGCFCALSVLIGLREAGCVLPQVRVYDPAMPFRCNCIYIPYNIATGLPTALFDRLWPHARTRKLLRYCEGSRNDPRYYPFPECEHVAAFCIRDFEEKVTAFLSEEFPRNFKRVQVARQEGSGNEKFAYAIGAERDHEIAAFVCAAGGQGRFLRELPGLPKELQVVTRYPNDPPKNHAFILQWSNTTVEAFAPRLKLGHIKKQLGAFVCPNNERLQCQLYCFPEAEPLSALFEEMKPEWAAIFGRVLRISNSVEPAHMDTKAMPGFPPGAGAAAESAEAKEAAAWFKRLREIVLQVALRVGIFDSSEDLKEGRNLDRVRIFYAQRGEYYYSQTHANVNGVPTFFVGDAAGSTDFRMGLSGGRGLYGAKTVADAIVAGRKTAASLADAAATALPAHQSWWDEVVKTEFGQRDPALNVRKDILAKYMIGDRTFCD